VQNNVKPVAGLLIASLCVDVILGNSTPFVVLVISNNALAAAADVPILIFAPAVSAAFLKVISLVFPNITGPEFQ